MIYEVRTYDLKPGSVAQWEGHFEAALPNRVKYSELAALWHTDIGLLNQVIHVWPYNDLAQRTEVRAKAAQEPGWPPQGGDLILAMESQIWTPAPFSPALGGNRKLGNVYEMRIYEYQPGSMPKVLAAWEKSLPKRLELSPIAGCLYTDIGGLNLWMHIWPYADLSERDRIRAASMQLPDWPPQTREWLVNMQNKIVVPAACSPMA